MTQLNLNAYSLIEDRLDEIGQRYRIFQLLRGVLWFVGSAIVVSVIAGMTAHWIGVASAEPTHWIWVILGVWGAWLLGSFLFLVVRPMVLRPRVLDTARFVESRVDGLHNALTNSVLLQRASDLGEHPYVPAILDENYRSASNKPLDQAVRFSDLRNLAIGVGVLAALFVGALCFTSFRLNLKDGQQRMQAPGVWVPMKRETEILDIKPGNIKLLHGQRLEIIAIARNPDPNAQPEGKVIFDTRGGETMEAVKLQPAHIPQDKLRYTAAIKSIEQPLRYRLDIGGTQSGWYEVELIKEIKLREVSLIVTPPGYTRRDEMRFSLTPESMGQNLIVPQGSKVEFSVMISDSVKNGYLEVAQLPPVEMSQSDRGRRLTASAVLIDDAQVQFNLTAGEGQSVGTLPEQPIVVRVQKDAPPVIEMRWPQQDIAVPLDQEIKIQATLRDDYNVTSGRVLWVAGAGKDPISGEERIFQDAANPRLLSAVLNIPRDLRKHENIIRVKLEAIDNRDLREAFKAHANSTKTDSTDDGGPQKTETKMIYEIRFCNPEEVAKEKKDQHDKLREELMRLLKTQQDLLTRAATWKPGDAGGMAAIHSGQTNLRGEMQTLAQKDLFGHETKVIQKTLMVLYHNTAAEAVEMAAAIPNAAGEKQQVKQCEELKGKQRRIISTLESLLALLNRAPEALVDQSKKGGDMPMQKEALEKLKEDLKKFLKEEQRIMDATAQLAKKPVDDFSDKDKKLLEELQMAQEKLDAFMQEKVNDVSKLAEQDMANSSLLKEMMEVYSEVTMAKNALKDKAMEIAVAAEEMGQEMAKEIESNLEKWLMDKPDRQEWKQEDAMQKSDIPMAELPKELEDMIGELMEQQEDLFEEMEDMDANWADSMDKGAGWDAADGPIANMSAKGVTGNQLPNNNNMNGRSGEGRSGKSQGEFVEETASGKGGRNTPTRLDPTPFQQGQVKDESKDPVGGATGGGKMSGQGGQGLEGPVPPKMKEEMKRLAEKQAQLRNAAEKLDLKYRVGRYDNFQFLEAIAIMRRLESDMKANRYQSAMRRKDTVLDRLDTSQALLAGRMHVQHDSSPTMSTKLEDKMRDVNTGNLPAAWKSTLEQYYKKLSQE